ncbi:uncharacterized protein LOC131050056 isoform X2 [Cryptomeria japonica]|uniref:uncharacterized protein LOC131050056 isoform X2 n=1 Tax=Cryptomeria japonica TaxID=3369 RepID=UPI0027DA9E10|nr:uncharacterized protein LOC131050056 isoform X2 [Cryptomeria japonica]
MKMKPRNEIKQKRRRNSQDFMTPSDDIILLSRFSKFYYKYFQEGNSVPIENLAPFLSHVEKYLQNKYTVGQISNRMIRLKEKYEVVKKNVENPEFCFNDYDSALYEWGSVIWGERPIDNIPPLIDRVKTPEKNKKKKHGEEKVEKEKENYNEQLLYVSDSEEDKGREIKRLAHIEILSSYEKKKEKDKEEKIEKEEEKYNEQLIYVSDFQEEKGRETEKLAHMEILPSIKEEKEKERGKIEFDEKNDWVAGSEEEEKDRESEKSISISDFYYELEKCLSDLKKSFSWKVLFP